MIIKALLPLIAVLKFKYAAHEEGEQFGRGIAQAYKACKEELKRSAEVSLTNPKD